MPPVKYHEGKFPPRNLDWEKLIPLIGPANAAVARYEGVLHGIPSSRVLLSPLTDREAVLSSKIEGTQATLEEVLEYEAEEGSATGEKEFDIQEILNYRKALGTAVSMLGQLPLSLRVVRQAHSVLLQGVRGENKTPGNFRRIENWIGRPGGEIKDARFIPPSAVIVPDLMSKWEKYLHEEYPDKLVQLAIAHAEFEAIHPFMDGNGRIGRLLVPLFMVDKGLLQSPDFYISAYLEARREEYYDRLLAVSREDDWTGWCVFFLQALIGQARENEGKALAIQSLYQKLKDWLPEITRSQYAIRALDWFFSRPIFKSSDFVNCGEIPADPAKRIIRVAKREGLFRELRPGRGRRAAILSFPDLLNIAE